MATACISAQPEVTLLPVSLGITQQPPATTSQPVGEYTFISLANKGCLMVANWCVGLCELVRKQSNLGIIYLFTP